MTIFKNLKWSLATLTLLYFKYNENAQRRKSKIWFNVEAFFFSESARTFIFSKEISNQFIVKYTSMNMIWLSGNEKSIERIYYNTIVKCNFF